MFDYIFKLITDVTVWFTFFTMILMFFNTYRLIKRMNKIDIYFNDIKLPIPILRKECTRGEIQGVLGVFTKDMQRYNIEFMGTIEYLNRLTDVQNNKSKKLVIDISEKELEQFKDELYKTNN
ncbi:hypothetical protein [Aliarcobacter skirrowii]|uniref:hypothetical protein n=1 Tax=Aliarcobacter skirrowii TaxID=28200 RepID=UPI002A3616DD|nr:hypothetical protein [Aliarcobacter skirrowii]MDY0181450.1 hypothetical protein [Aliarcobacter skirrowii]